MSEYDLDQIRRETEARYDEGEVYRNKLDGQLYWPHVRPLDEPLFYRFDQMIHWQLHGRFHEQLNSRLRGQTGSHLNASIREKLHWCLCEQLHFQLDETLFDYLLTQLREA